MPDDRKVKKLQSDSPAIRVDADYPDVAYLDAGGKAKYIMWVNGDGTLTIELLVTKKNQSITAIEDRHERLTVGVQLGEPE